MANGIGAERRADGALLQIDDRSGKSSGPQDLRELMGTLLAEVAVNSAGILLPAKFEEMDPEDLEKMIDVNLLGTVHTMQTVLPIMRKAGRGSIVNIASLAGRRGMSPLGGYCATKFAVTGLSEAVRTELFGSGITVSLVMPGLVDTPMATGAVRKTAQGLEKVPPGAGTAEKLAALFPGATDALLAMGTRMMAFVSAASKRSS